MFTLPKAFLRKILLLTSYFSLLTSLVFAQSDTTPPTTTHTLTGTTGLNDWYTTSVEVKLEASDLESGVKEINWRLNENPLEKETFSETLNLVKNPSFEDNLNYWEFLGTEGALGTQDTTRAKFGTASARIESLQSGWSGFNNKSNYAVASSWENMSASVWVYTEGIEGVGAFFKIYALTEGGEVFLGESQKALGGGSWVKLEKLFSVAVEGAYGVYIDLGIDGLGVAFFDGATLTKSVTNPAVTFTISQNGEHTLEYYSVDNAGNVEPSNYTSFKIDTRAPGNWTNFTLVEGDNNHTFKILIGVTDISSGLDVSEAQFQYSVNEGENWGYYSNLGGSCSAGDWVEGGWHEASVSPATDGVSTATVSTPFVDFCNSNWAETKKIRFRITDLAGNKGQSPDFALNGAWFRATGGDIHSNASISSAGPSRTQFLPSSQGLVSNLSSDKNWFVSDYEKVTSPGFEDLEKRLSPTTPLPQGKLPTENGIFLVKGDFTVDNQTIPGNFENVENFSAVVFIKGDLLLNNDYALHQTSSLSFVVKKDVEVKSGVENFEGFFIVGEEFNSGGGNKALKIKGGVAAYSFELTRSLPGNKNQTEPAEVFDFLPKYLILPTPYFGQTQFTWREIY